LQVPKQNTEEFWNTTLPGEFFEYIVDHPIKYDAVIVDEAQDFRVEFWDSVPELVGDDGWFYIFYDPDQNLFDTKLQIPNLGHEFMLTKNCRNTNAIFNEIKNIASIKITSDDAPEGSPVEHFSAKSANDTRNILSRILHSLVVNERISNEHIVILGAHNLKHTSLGSDNKVKTFTIWENQKLPDEKSIAYHTYYKFKGCESNVVIILDYNKNDDAWSKQATLYTAMSRAKHKLYIIEIEL
jgi:superfamily I DNA and RNA helicase